MTAFTPTDPFLQERMAIIHLVDLRKGPIVRAVPREMAAQQLDYALVTPDTCTEEAVRIRHGLRLNAHSIVRTVRLCTLSCGYLV